jgi:hypothetical protein
VPPLRTRKPTGLAPWPFLVINGDQGTGKTHLLAQLAASTRIGKMWALDWDEEGTLDELAALPGVTVDDFEMIDHNGRWFDIIGQLRAVCAEALQQVKAGGKVPVLGIDSMSAPWDCLKNWVDERAMRSPANQRLLADDPAADIRATNPVWNSANKRHDELMEILISFPGIVIMTARSKTTIAIDEDGKPAKDDRGRPIKVLKVETQKKLLRRASVVVQLGDDHPPLITKARSAHSGIRPGVNPAKEVRDLTLDWLIFDYLKCGTQSTTRTLAEHSTRTAFATEEEMAAAKRQVWARAQELGWDYPALAKHFLATTKMSISDADAEELLAYIPAMVETVADQDDKAATDALDAARVVEALDEALDGDAVNALWGDLKALWDIRIIGRDATVGELANLKVAKLKAAVKPDVPPETPKRSEMIALLDKLGVAETERVTVLSGLAGRPVTGIHNLQGDARDLVVNELQNLAALEGPARDRLIGDVLTEGVEINARIPA